MTSPISNNQNTAILQSLQSRQTTAAAVQPVSASTVAGRVEAVRPVTREMPRYDSVTISEEGRQASAANAAAKTDATGNAAMLRELNAPGDSGLSFVQQAKMNLRAGMSAANMMSGISGAGSKTSGAGSLDMVSLLGGVTEANSARVIFRNAGASALGINMEQSTGLEGLIGGGESDSNSNDAAQKLGDYSVDELRGLLREGVISTGDFISELQNREAMAEDVSEVDTNDRETVAQEADTNVREAIARSVVENSEETAQETDAAQQPKQSAAAAALGVIQ